MSEKENRTTLMRYAGLATQLLVMLGLAVWGGLQLDEWLHLRALFVIVLPVVALAVALLQLIRSLNKTQKP